MPLDVVLPARWSAAARAHGCITRRQRSRAHGAAAHRGHPQRSRPLLRHDRADQLGLGIATALAMYALGMPNAMLWGVLAGVLNFIPYLGPIAACFIFACAALVTFDEPGTRARGARRVHRPAPHRGTTRAATDGRPPARGQRARDPVSASGSAMASGAFRACCSRRRCWWRSRWPRSYQPNWRVLRDFLAPIGHWHPKSLRGCERGPKPDGAKAHAPDAVRSQAARVASCTVLLTKRCDALDRPTNRVRLRHRPDQPCWCTALVLAIGANLATTEKRLLYRPRRLYTSGDADFRRALGILLGPPLVAGQPDHDARERRADLSGDARTRSARRRPTSPSRPSCSATASARRSSTSCRTPRGAACRSTCCSTGWARARWTQNLLAAARAAGCEVHLYHPPSWYHLGRLNNRTHRKLLVVDGKIGFTGGVGMGIEWKDGLTGPAALARNALQGRRARRRPDAGGVRRQLDQGHGPRAARRGILSEARATAATWTRRCSAARRSAAPRACISWCCWR